MMVKLILKKNLYGLCKSVLFMFRSCGFHSCIMWFKIPQWLWV